jgi:hypothetical protein
MKAGYLLASFVAFALLHSTANAFQECMATLAAPNGYTLTGSLSRGDDNEGTTTVKPGECFIAVKP